jgi:hypothetical protein
MRAGSIATVAPSKKGTGFVQPAGPHQHWHVHVSYLSYPNLAGTFYFLITFLDGYNQSIVDGESGIAGAQPEAGDRFRPARPGSLPRQRRTYRKTRDRNRNE